ncbi:TIGR03617 family F420-dependent LLM class oxidoreductase [Nocardia jinanensis]|uniref:LLM class F420-dependent oxidoreductase n=1 Tax=Nocardia jinanensis TaxID=382504 RepID=A0A917RKK2_9NOCA|nr:TIGR03617 family F420-dependent LLM class oxidoreductase [Nocardia jinanensis]GGL13004.1 LLM class F420-dependent oxidoreductase [Nocardia jinanensis]
MTESPRPPAVLDVAIDPGTGPLGEMAADVERSGFGGLFLGETCHDPLLLLAAASQATSTLRLGTSIYVAFARSPMVTAIAANDVHTLSAGRLTLGLGSQIKPHITRRFSMPWSRPAARMREYVLALRAIWGSWENSAPLRFEGEFYHHTLMTPMFDPGPNPYGNPPVIVAGVGERMARVAGEVADGLLVHSFVTETYLREVLLPSVEDALAAAGRARDEFEVIVSPMVATGATDADIAQSREFVRGQIAFYGSTPAYRGVLDLHGWSGLHEDLYRLSKEGDWARMPTIVPDDVVDGFAVSASVERAAAEVGRRWGPVADRISVTAATDSALSAWRAAPKVYDPAVSSPLR